MVLPENCFIAVRDGTELFSTSLCNFAQFGTRIVISPFALTIATTFSVEKTRIGLALTILWAAFALMQFPSGVFADRRGEKLVITVSLVLTALGSIVIAFAPTFGAFVVAAAVLGGGAGLYFSVGASLVSKLYERQQSLALAVHSAGGPVAGVVLPLVAVEVAQQVGWRWGVATGAVAAVAALGAARLSLSGAAPEDDEGSEPVRPEPLVSTVFSLLRRRSILFTIGIATAGMYALQSIVSFFPAFLQEYHGVDPGNASVLFSSLFLLMAVGLPVVGRAADVYGSTIGISVPMVVTAVSLVSLLLQPRWLPVTVGAVGIGAGLTWGGALQSRFMQRLEKDQRGTGFGLSRSVFILLGASGNVCTGYFSQHFGWTAGYGIVAAVLLLTAGAVLANRRFRWGL